ncbi:MAG: Flagellar biosynthetic protein FliR [Firmicutes bacterium ADurb.Bin356]|nr:MAG: Flagellar biosynthetic protein FliR [Firmicutes bacterium ADurb.Bin356]
MERAVSAVASQLEYFILIFLRVSALIFSSPVFGRRNLPNQLKISLSLALAYIVLAATPGLRIFSYNSILEYALLCVKELLFGLVLGYVTTLFFAIAQVAGHVIDMQMGFGMVNVFDVQSNISVPVTGNFLYAIMMLVFFAVNGHQQLIYIVLKTFTNIPPGRVVLNAGLGITALEVFALSFAMALNIAMPIVASGLLGEAIMGVIVRTTPQMNVFVVGIPLKVLLGLAALLLILPIYVAFTGEVFTRMFSSLDYMLKGLGGS